MLRFFVWFLFLSIFVAARALLLLDSSLTIEESGLIALTGSWQIQGPLATNAYHGLFLALIASIPLSFVFGKREIHDIARGGDIKDITWLQFFAFVVSVAIFLWQNLLFGLLASLLISLAMYFIFGLGMAIHFSTRRNDYDWGYQPPPDEKEDTDPELLWRANRNLFFAPNILFCFAVGIIQGPSSGIFSFLVFTVVSLAGWLIFSKLFAQEAEEETEKRILASD